VLTLTFYRISMSCSRPVQRTSKNMLSIWLGDRSVVSVVYLRYATVQYSTSLERIGSDRRIIQQFSFWHRSSFIALNSALVLACSHSLFPLFVRSALLYHIEPCGVRLDLDLLQSTVQYSTVQYIVLYSEISRPLLHP
jgi:hypothetical protein